MPSGAPPRTQLDGMRAEVTRLRAEADELRALVEGMNCIVLRWDPRGRVLFLNTHGQEFFGYTMDELRGRSVVGTLVPPTETSGRDLAQLMEDILARPEDFLSNENENMRKSGERVWVTWRNRPLLDADGRLREIVSTGIDTTLRKRAEDASVASERQYRVLFQSTPVALLEGDASGLKAHLDNLTLAGVVDVDAYVEADPERLKQSIALIRTLDWNAALTDLLEARDEQGLDAAHVLIEAAGWRDTGGALVRAVAAGRVVWQEREATIRTLKGNRRDVVMRSTIIPGHEETFARVLVAVVDITERKHAEEVLRQSADTFRELAARDNLTGLFNTRHLYEALERLLRDGRVQGSPVSVVFLDIDHFKEVVDARGHLLGSRTIQEVGATIRRAVTDPAFAVAYAGDEFVVVLPGAGRAAALAFTEGLRRRISRTAYLRGEPEPIRLSASFGIATFPDDADDLQALLAEADRALFDAKTQGRNVVRVATGDPR